MPNIYEEHLAKGDYKPFLNSVRGAEGEDGVKRLVNEYAEPILIHYIECTWGVCYNSRFKDMIQPYLNDPSALDKVLRSDTIKEHWSNVIHGATGAKVFPELLRQLKQCTSLKILDYLRKEFPN